MAKKLPIEYYIEKARQLKKLGVIDSIPKKAEFTSGVKSKISRFAREFKQVIKRPDDFKIAKTDEKNLQVFKKSGYKTKNGRVIIPLADGKDNRFETAKIGKGTIEYKRKGKTNKVFLSGDSAALMKKAAELQSKKGRNQVVTFSLRGFAVSSQDYSSYDAMMNYLQNVILPKVVMSARRAGKSKKEATKEFWSSVSIVTIGDKVAKRKK